MLENMLLAYQCTAKKNNKKTELIKKLKPVITVSECGKPWEVKHASSIHPHLQLIELSGLFLLLDNDLSVICVLLFLTSH